MFAISYDTHNHLFFHLLRIATYEEGIYFTRYYNYLIYVAVPISRSALRGKPRFRKRFSHQQGHTAFACHSVHIYRYIYMQISCQKWVDFMVI